MVVTALPKVEKSEIKEVVSAMALLNSRELKQLIALIEKKRGKIIRGRASCPVIPCLLLINNRYSCYGTKWACYQRFVCPVNPGLQRD